MRSTASKPPTSNVADVAPRPVRTAFRLHGWVRVGNEVGFVSAVARSTGGSYSVTVLQPSQKEIKVSKNDILALEDFPIAEERWVDANTCQQCMKEFTKGFFGSGQFHCRSCGLPICGNCSSNPGRTLEEQIVCRACYIHRKIKLYDVDRSASEFRELAGTCMLASGAGSQAASQRVGSDLKVHQASQAQSKSGLREAAVGMAKENSILSYTVFDPTHSPESSLPTGTKCPNRKRWSKSVESFGDAALIGCSVYMEKLAGLEESQAMTKKVAIGGGVAGAGLAIGTIITVATGGFGAPIGLGIAAGVLGGTFGGGGVALHANTDKMWHYYTVWTIRRPGSQENLYIRVERHAVEGTPGAITITRLTADEATTQRADGSMFDTYQNRLMDSAYARYSESQLLPSPTVQDLLGWLQQEVTVPYDIVSCNCQHLAKDMWAKFTHTDYELEIHMDYYTSAGSFTKAVFERTAQGLNTHKPFNQLDQTKTDTGYRRRDAPKYNTTPRQTSTQQLPPTPSATPWKDLLVQFRLSRFIPQMEESGYDFVDEWSDISDEELEEIGMNRNCCRRWAKMLAHIQQT